MDTLPPWGGEGEGGEREERRENDFLISSHGHALESNGARESTAAAVAAAAAAVCGLCPTLHLAPPPSLSLSIVDV